MEQQLIQLRKEVETLRAKLAQPTEIKTLSSTGTGPLKVLAFSGSLRSASANAGLLRAAAEQVPEGATLEVVDISALPLLNTDLEQDELPAAVASFQTKVQAADAFLFAIPEYNYSMAAPFKNAVDWASRAKGGHGMAGKVVGILGAGGSRGTALAQMHFRQTAVFFGLHVVNKPEVMVNAFEKDAEGNLANVNLKNGDLVNDKLKARVGDLLGAVCKDANLVAARA